jgi:hypothetical protein
MEHTTAHLSLLLREREDKFIDVSEHFHVAS